MTAFIENTVADIKRIVKLIPHRYPMLLVDRVLECEPGKRIVAQKNVTINEPFFQGHFPYHPVMPGVLIVEALAQTAARAGRRVVLWEHDAKNAQQLIDQRESLYLPGVTLDPAISVTRDLAEAARVTVAHPVDRRLGPAVQ